MAIVVVGGHTRSVGKTSVVASLIAALPGFQWTAFKITQYGHGVCSLNGKSCDCAADDHSWAITEEKSRSADSDTSRFLQAGAQRVWWVRTEQGRLAEAMPSVRKTLAGATNAILESNSVIKFVHPDLYLTVLDPAIADFKRSAQEFLDQADAVILHRENAKTLAWNGVSLKPVAGRPIFEITPPEYVTKEIVEFVRERVLAAQSQIVLRP